MDLLVITFVAVAIAVLIGFPLAVWMGTAAAPARVITPVIDLHADDADVRLPGRSCSSSASARPAAVVCTLVYALPPIVRIAGHGIRHVSPTTIEATDSLGQTTWQRLVKVQLPMARSTIVVGLNQTIMAALSMATIAAYINGPGLGKPVLGALTNATTSGVAFVPGLLIVLMAIMLDRTTTAASQRSENVAARRWRRTRRLPADRPGRGRSRSASAVCVLYSSRASSLGAPGSRDRLGSDGQRVDGIFDWCHRHLRRR